MNEAAAHVLPVVYVTLADDDHIGRDPQATQRPPQANRLGRDINDLRLDHQEVEIASGSRLTSGMRAEQDYTRAWSRVRESAPSLDDRGLVDHGRSR
jgi:hypothetical protein